MNYETPHEQIYIWLKCLGMVMPKIILKNNSEIISKVD